MSTSTTVAAPSFAFLFSCKAAVIISCLPLPAFFEHTEDSLSGAGVSRNPGALTVTQMFQKWRFRRVVVQPGDLDGDRAEGGGRVARGEDILLPKTVPLGGRQDAHRRDARLLQGVMTLGSDGEPAHRA